MAVDAKQYLEGLAQTAGLDAETKAALLKAIENDKFASALAASVSRQEDYSRNMDALRKDRETFDAEKGTWKDWYAQATAREAEIQTELEDLRKKANAGGGGGAGGGTGDTLTRKQFDDQLAVTRGQLISVVKDAAVIAARHAVEFPTVPFDINAIEKLALEKGLTVAKAYEEYVRPQVEQRSKDEFERKLKEAHDAGVKEGLSKSGLPDDSAAPRGHHVLFDRPKATDGNAPATVDGRTKVANFAEAWNAAATK